MEIKSFTKIFSSASRGFSQEVNIDNNAEEINVIPTNQYARAMRLMMEDKNLLAKAGSIYIGTGAKQIVKPATGDGVEPVEVPITAALNPPDNTGVDAIYTLKCKVLSNGSVQIYWE